MADTITKGTNGITPSSGHRGVSFTAELEDYFRVQYPQYWNEQFYMTDGIYAYTKKVPIKANYHPIGYKITRASNNSYSLGTTFGREGGDNTINEDYSIGITGNERAGERITGKVVTRRFLSVFHFTDDFLYKAETGDLEFDLLADILADRELIQQHALKRRIYLGKDGLITSVAKAVVGRTASAAGTVTGITGTAANILYNLNDTTTHAGIIGGSGLPRNVVGAVTGDTGTPSGTVPMISVAVENDAYFAEGEKYLFKSAGTSGILAGESGTTAFGGFNITLWQKDYTNPDQPLLVFIVHTDEAYAENGHRTAMVVGTSGILVKSVSSKLPGIYSVQLEQGANKSIGTAIQPEYEGLRDLLFTQNNVVTGINRNVYKQFNCTITDLKDTNNNPRILTAEALQKHMNILARRNPELVNSKVISASPEALTAVETSMLQLHQYVHDPVQNGQVNIGFKAVKFYDHDLLKDDFAEHGKAYIIAKEELGEVIFRDWEWITGGAEGRLGFLDRIPQTGIYEGFMVREANTFFEKFNVHSGFINVAENISTARFSGLENA